MDVAAMVGRYDRDLARQVLDRFVRTRLPKLTAGGGRETLFEAESLMTAAAFVGPHQAASLLGRFPEEEREGQPTRDRMRVAIVTVLATRPGPERWRRLERKFLHVWSIDEEDDF